MVWEVVWLVQWSHYLSLIHDLPLWSTFPVKGYLDQPRYGGEDRGTASNDVTDFVDSQWEASPSPSSGWEQRGLERLEGEGTGIDK